MLHQTVEVCMMQSDGNGFCCEMSSWTAWHVGLKTTFKTESIKMKSSHGSIL